MRPYFFSALVALFLCPVFARAGDWRSDFKTPDAIDCCGIHDCQPKPRLSTVTIGDRIVVFPDRLPVDATTVTIVHPSRDHQVWVCTTGCAFVPGMM